MTDLTRLDRPRHELTILAVADLQASRRFYAAAFGWPLRVEASVYAEFDLGGGRGLGLYDRQGYAANTGRLPVVVPEGEISGTEIYFRCDDLEAGLARLEAAGARPLSPRAGRDWGEEAAYYADPDGNVLVLARALGVPEE